MTRIRETRETAEDVLRRISERSRKRVTVPPDPREEPPEAPASGAYSITNGKRRGDV